jgi:hypothetical protein
LWYKTCIHNAQFYNISPNESASRACVSVG